MIRSLRPMMVFSLTRTKMHGMMLSLPSVRGQPTSIVRNWCLKANRYRSDIPDLTSGLLTDETIGRSSVRAHRLSRSFDEVENSFVFDVSRFLLNGTPSQKATFEPEENLEWPRCPTPTPAAEDELGLPHQIAKSKPRKPKVLAVSRRGISYSPLPARVVKTVASRFQRLYAKGGKATIKGDTLIALAEASNEFFEQFGYDLKAYAQHAKRKKINESDVTIIMKR